MADISSYIRLIELAARGEEVRDAIINALTSMNREAYGEFDDEPTAGSGKAVTSDAIKTALDGKQDILTFDNTPTLNSNNPVKSGGIYSAMQAMQEALQFDEEPTENSTNPVTSGGIYNALQDVEIVMDEAPTANSDHAVKSKGIKTALDAKQDTLQFDLTPTQNSGNPVTSGGMWAVLAGVSSVVRLYNVTLNKNNWSGNGPYSQAVTLQGVTANSKVDIQASSATIAQMLSDGVQALWIENNAGTLTAYCIGAVPTENLAVQCSVANLDTTSAVYDSVPTQNSGNPVTSGGVWSALKAMEISVDGTLSSSSENPVQNKVIWQALQAVEPTWGNISSKPTTLTGYGVTVDSTPTENSSNPVTSGGVWSALQASAPTWANISNKPTTLTGYGITVDTAPTENSSNPVTSGGIYNAVLAKENTSNKKTRITASSTDIDYPSAKAVWSLFFSLQEEISRLKARVTALENGDTPAAAVENNILEVYNGEMNGTVLELEGAYVDENNTLVFGAPSGMTVSNNILEVDGSMNGTVLELNGASVDGENNLTEEGGQTATMNNGILSLGNVSVTGNILEVDGVMDGTTMNL